MTGTSTSTKSAEIVVTEASSAFVAFLLARFRVAALRAKIVANEIESTATALSAGLISAEAALLHLHETGAAGLIPTSSA
jgi:hypothetical protein